MATPLAEDLFEESMQSLEKVGAYVTSGGDQTVMASFVKPPSPWILLGITIGLLAIIVVLIEFANWQDVRQNWPHYRCDPRVTPFAKFYGHNLQETMNFCINEAVKEHAPGVVAPIYKSLNEVMGVVDGIYDRAEAVEGGVMTLLSGFESFLVNFANSFRLLGTRVRMSLVRIRDIFSRVYGIFMAFTYAGISAMTFGSNLVDNPLVQFVDDIGCFEASTPVELADGTTKAISQITIGDALAGGTKVTSTYRFDGRKTKMVKIHGIHVSGNHQLCSGGRADEHPDATVGPSLDEMWCLATSNHEIPIRDASGSTMLFYDFEESTEPDVIRDAQRAAEEALNGFAGPTVPDYELGLDPKCQVLMEHGSWKRLGDLELGDRVAGGGAIIGVVRELCPSVMELQMGTLVSAAQLLRVQGPWIRAFHHYAKVSGPPRVLCHIITEENSPFTIALRGRLLSVRDYLEVHVPEVQAPYDEILKRVPQKLDLGRCSCVKQHDGPL